MDVVVANELKARDGTAIHGIMVEVLGLDSRWAGAKATETVGMIVRNGRETEEHYDSVDRRGMSL